MSIDLSKIGVKATADNKVKVDNPGALVPTSNGSKDAKKTAPDYKDLVVSGTKLVYAFDISYSMADLLVSTKDLDQWDWAREWPRIMKHIDRCNAQVREALGTSDDEDEADAVAAADPDDPDDEDDDPDDEDDDPDDEDDDPDDEDDEDEVKAAAPKGNPALLEELKMFNPDTFKWAALKGRSEQDIKFDIVEMKLFQNFHIEYNMDKYRTLKSKLAIIQQQAVKFVAERYDKYNNPDVTVIAFNERPHLVATACPKDKMLREINGLSPCGGTSIAYAIEAAVQVCEQRPSAMGVHHLVLITDGEDGCTKNYVEGALRNRMEALHMVVDFIHISQNPRCLESEDVQYLKSLCEATGGQYVLVDDPDVLASRFLEASARLCLPPAR